MRVPSLEITGVGFPSSKSSTARRVTPSCAPDQTVKRAVASERNTHTHNSTQERLMLRNDFGNLIGSLTEMDKAISGDSHEKDLGL